jgi:hypothetical protein
MGSVTLAPGGSAADGHYDYTDQPLGQDTQTGDTGAVPYDPTIYLGAAARYRRGRPAYSPELETVLSFHWTDERHVAETVYDLLEPGGALALIVHTATGRPRPPDPGVPAIPHDEIKALVEKYLGATRRAGKGTAPERTHRFEDVLVRTRFGVPRRFFVPGIPDLLRDSQSVLSGYLSLSSAAPHLFGDRLDDFTGEVRALLAERSAVGLFWDWPGDTEVVLARKPGPTPQSHP